MKKEERMKKAKNENEVIASNLRAVVRRMAPAVQALGEMRLRLTSMGVDPVQGVVTLTLDLPKVELGSKWSVSQVR